MFLLVVYLLILQIILKINTKILKIVISYQIINNNYLLEIKNLKKKKIIHFNFKMTIYTLLI